MQFTDVTSKGFSLSVPKQCRWSTMNAWLKRLWASSTNIHLYHPTGFPFCWTARENCSNRPNQAWETSRSTSRWGKCFCNFTTVSDCISKWQAVESVMIATRGRGRFSSHLLKECILMFYERKKLWPKGLVRGMECVDAWALKQGLALQRLAS